MKDLAKLLADKARKHKYIKRLESHNNERDLLEKEIKEKTSQLEKENKDVAELQKISFTRLFAILSGNETERLEKEQQEAYRAAKSLELVTKKLRDLENHMEELQNHIDQLSHVEDELQQVIAEKEATIHSTDPVLREVLAQLDHQLAAAEVRETELKQAKEAAEQATEFLSQAYSNLTSAKSWGILDLAGGDTVSTIVKRGYMDDAMNELEEAGKHLQLLRSELDDLDEELTESLTISDFLSVTDLFFDNIFSDWAVQERIMDSIDHVEACMSKLEDLQGTLNEESLKVKQELLKLRDTRLEFLKDA